MSYLRGEGADQEVCLGQEVDVQDDPTQRVLGVAVVEARRPRDGVIADELIVRIPGGREEDGTFSHSADAIEKQLELNRGSGTTLYCGPGPQMTPLSSIHFNGASFLCLNIRQTLSGRALHAL